MFVFGWGWGWGGGVCRRINNYMLNFVFWTPKLFKSWYLLCSLAFSFLPDWPLCRVQGGQNLHIFCPHHHRLIAAQSIAQIATYSPPNTSLTAPSTSNLLKISANGDLMSRLRARVKMTFTNMVQLLIWGLLYANEIFRKRIFALTTEANTPHWVCQTHLTDPFILQQPFILISFQYSNNEGRHQLLSHTIVKVGSNWNQ